MAGKHYWDANLMRSKPYEMKSLREANLITSKTNEKQTLWESNIMTSKPYETQTLWEANLMRSKPNDKQTLWDAYLIFKVSWAEFSITTVRQENVGRKIKTLIMLTVKRKSLTCRACCSSGPPPPSRSHTGSWPPPSGACLEKQIDCRPWISENLNFVFPSIYFK